MITSAIKKQTSDCCSISLYPYMAFQTWNHGKKRKRKAILLFAYIADVSCLTNRSLRTLSLTFLSVAKKWIEQSLATELSRES